MEDSPLCQHLGQEISVWRKLEHPNVQKLCGLYWCNDGGLPQLVSVWQDYGHIKNYLDHVSRDLNISQISLIKFNLVRHSRMSRTRR